MRVLRSVAAWSVALGLLACDDATNLAVPKTDAAGGTAAAGGSDFNGDAFAGASGQGGRGGDTSPADAAPAGGGASADARTGEGDGQVFPKPDGQMPPPDADARVNPPDPDARVNPPLPDARVNPPDPDARVNPPDPDARVNPPEADAAVILDPDAGATPPGALRLTKARIVWTVGPLGTGTAIGSTNTSRNGFLRLTGRVLFATGGLPP